MTAKRTGRQNMIILVFLLMSFSSEDYDFVLQEGMTLPQSTSQGTFRPAVNVVVHRDFIKVEENVVARFDRHEREKRRSSSSRPTRRSRTRRSTS